MRGLLVGLLVALLALTLQLQTQPFKKDGDDAVSFVVQLMLVFFFILGFVIKLCDADDGPALAGGQASCPSLFGLGSAWGASLMIVCVGFGVMLILIGLFVRQLLSARSMPTLRDARTMQPPVLLLGKGERYHLFLCAAVQPAPPRRAPRHTVLASLRALAVLTSGVPAKTSARSSSGTFSSCFRASWCSSTSTTSVHAALV